MINFLLIFLIAVLFGFTGWFYFSRTVSKPVPTPPSEKKVIKIGILSQKTNKTYETSVASMKAELTRLGYNPEYLQDDIKDNNEFPEVAKRYVKLGVDVLVTNSTPATKAALDATSQLPIVFGSVGDPVVNGVAQSLDSSGNNATGVSSLSIDLAPKRLDLLVESIPDVKRVYFIHQPEEIASENSKKRTVVEAKTLSISLVERDATNSTEVKNLSLELKSSEAGAITMASSGMIWGSVATLIEAQNRERIPLIGVDRTMTERGTVFSYGPNYAVMGQQLASLVDQVLKGSKPQYIAIQRPKKVEFIINKKAANNIGLIIPENVLAKADEVIK